MKIHRLVVTEKDGRVYCTREGDTGMAVVGEGMTVLEAIGSWCLYQPIITARCDPPSLLDERFQMGFTPADRRG